MAEEVKKCTDCKHYRWYDQRCKATQVTKKHPTSDETYTVYELCRNINSKGDCAKFEKKGS